MFVFKRIRRYHFTNDLFIQIYQLFFIYSNFFFIFLFYHHKINIFPVTFIQRIKMEWNISLFLTVSFSNIFISKLLVQALIGFAFRD